MAHSVRDQQKLLHRAHRIRGQVDGIARLLEAEADCGKVLQQLVAVRGAVQGLMAEILEDHVRYHVVDPRIDPASEQGQATEELVELLHSYLR